MKIINYIIIIACPFLMISCEYKMLSKESLEWQPYSIGDIIIFQNNQGDSDTIIITKISNRASPTDPLDIFPSKFQTISVKGEIIPRKPKFTYDNLPFPHDQIQILKLQSSYYSDDIILFNIFNTNDTLSYPDTELEIKELISLDREFKYPIEIIAKHDYPTDFEYDLQKFKWSKEHGYQEFIFRNGDTLKLVKSIPYNLPNTGKNR